MPEIQFPTSDIGRLALLKRVQRTASNRLAAGDAIVEQSLLDELAAFLADYEPKVNAVQDTLGDRMRETKERQQAIERLDMFARDFFVVLKRRMRRNGEPAELWRSYGMQADGVLPDPKSPDELLQWGERIVAGDAKAVEAGYPAMTNPSAEEVNGALATAQAEMDDVPQADLAYDQAQEAAQAERARADDFIRRVNMLLDYKLYGQERPSVRRTKRGFGFGYKYQAGETRDADDPAPALAPTDEGIGVGNP